MEANTKGFAFFSLFDLTLRKVEMEDRYSGFFFQLLNKSSKGVRVLVHETLVYFVANWNKPREACHFLGLFDFDARNF